MRTSSIRRRFRPEVLLSSLFLFATSLHAQMLTPGQFQVSESGAATYTIPIQVSPGVGGMEPKLSLNYSSQSGNGLLGVGWSLGGLGGVGRCARTMAQDGVRGGVNYDSNDRYCLDGQRLIAISGSEGGDGTEYRTERESFAKIVSYGAAGNGPAWFKVWTKAGQVVEYGRTIDARIDAQGKTSVRVWALNRIEDTKGNYLTASYTKDAANGDYYPSRIDYTGNSKTNTAPTNSVQFQYETRPDIMPAFQAGSLIKNAVRLKTISIFNLESLIKQSSLTYVTSVATSRSLLSLYRECNTGGGNCLPALKFDFSDKAFEFAGVQGGKLFDGGFGTPDQYTKQVVDLNGDGIADLVWMYSGSSGLYVYTALGKGDGTFYPVQGGKLYDGGFGTSADYSRIATDINGDGIADLVWMYSSTTGLYVYTALGKGDSTFGAVQGGTLRSGDFGATGDYSKIVTDINGDGIADLIWMYSSPGGLYVYTTLGKGDGTFYPTSGGKIYDGGFGESDVYSKQVADLNGDGIADLVWMYSGSGLYVYTALGKGDGTFYPVQGGKLYDGGFGTSADYSRIATDINGDGIADLVWMYSSTSGLYVYTALGKGDGTFGAVQGGTLRSGDFGVTGDYSRIVTDINGDGIADLIWMYSSPGGLYVYTTLGKGDGTFYPTSGGKIFDGGFGTSDLYSKQVVDFSGDGAADLMWIYSGPSGLYAYSAKNLGLQSERMSKITMLNASTDISYASLTNGNIYVKDQGVIGAKYPQVDVQAPVFVVSAVATSNGVGGATRTSYIYGGLKSDLTGRGLLGFRWMETKQIETGLTSYTEYQQTWPYTGLPRLIKKSLVGTGNNGVLSQVANTYGCNDAANTTATPCSVGVGKRYFLYANQSIENGWDSNGAALPVITTKTEYDNWGNATKVDVGTSDGYGKTTINNYSNDSSNWYLGRLLKATVMSTAP